MNERIRELAEQAGLLGPSSRVGNSHDATERFAELIVRECVGKYDEWAEHSTDKTSFAMARHNVKKHFGIKE